MVEDVVLALIHSFFSFFIIAGVRKKGFFFEINLTFTGGVGYFTELKKKKMLPSDKINVSFLLLF